MLPGIRTLCYSFQLMKPDTLEILSNFEELCNPEGSHSSSRQYEVR